MFNKSQIMKRAWQIARADRDYARAYDWTPGITYGSVRATTTAEKRAVFARALRGAWAAAKFEEAGAAPRRPASEAAQKAARFQLQMLEGKDLWTREDYRLADALRHAA